MIHSLSKILLVGTNNQKKIEKSTFSTSMKPDSALSMSIACMSPETYTATAAAISDGLNSKKSIPAFNFSINIQFTISSQTHTLGVMRDL